MSTRPPRQVVCDTGPLISLEKITSGYRFIGRLYDQLLVPPAVMEELVAGQFEMKGAYLRHFDAEDLVVVEPMSEAGPAGTVEKKTTLLDKGERQAIQLAFERELPLLIEEEMGRKWLGGSGFRFQGLQGSCSRPRVRE